MGSTASLAVRRLGEGTQVVLIHGGLGPELTWEAQEQLAEGWALVIPSRRGYGDSPPAERQDFEADADDLQALLEEPAHLVGFSYGGLGAAIVAARAPDRVRSLSLIEPPLYAATPKDPEVEHLALLGESFAISEEPEQESEFLALAGLGPAARGQHRAALDETLAASRNLRSPREATPDFRAIADAPSPP